MINGCVVERPAARPLWDDNDREDVQFIHFQIMRAFHSHLKASSSAHNLSIQRSETLHQTHVRHTCLFFFTRSSGEEEKRTRKKSMKIIYWQMIFCRVFFLRFVYKTLKKFLCDCGVKGVKWRENSFRDIEVFINFLPERLKNKNQHYMCKSIKEQHTMNINSRFLWAVLDMESPHFLNTEPAFNCLFFSPLHYRIMTYKNKLEFCRVKALFSA